MGHSIRWGWMKEKRGKLFNKGLVVDGIDSDKRGKGQELGRLRIHRIHTLWHEKKK